MANATLIEFPHNARERGMKTIYEYYEGPPGFDSVVAWLLEQKEKYHDVEIEYEDEGLAVSHKVPFTEEEGRLAEARAAWLSTPMFIKNAMSWQGFMYGYYDRKEWPYPHPDLKPWTYP